VSSVAALVTPQGYTIYGASKAGLAAASEALRREVRGSGVHVVTVYPGPVHSELAKRGVEGFESSPWVSRAPWGTADELARLVRRAVDKKKARVIYPRFYALTRWFPPLARWVTDRTTPAPRHAQVPSTATVEAQRGEPVAAGGVTRSRA
jgi:short-subunit dehydrogenase